MRFFMIVMGISLVGGWLISSLLLAFVVNDTPVWVTILTGILLVPTLLFSFGLMTSALAVGLTLYRPRLYCRYRYAFSMAYHLAYPLDRFLVRFFGVPEDRMKRNFRRLNNKIIEGIFSTEPPKSILILLPRCLQSGKCKLDVASDIENCRSCGLCQIKDLLEYREKYGIDIKLNLRSHLAIDELREIKPDLAIGVACDSRLVRGMFATTSSYSYLISLDENNRCYDNTIMIDKLKAAMNIFYHQTGASS